MSKPRNFNDGLKKRCAFTVVFCLMLFTMPCYAQLTQSTLTHYDIKVQIHPEKRHMAVHMTLTLSPESESLEFLLHRQFS